MRAAAFALIAWCGLPAEIHAQDSASTSEPIPYATVGGWDIMIGLDTRPTCFISAAYENGVAVRFGPGLESDPRKGYLEISGPTLGDLDPGTEYDVTVRFDARAPLVAKGRTSSNAKDRSVTIGFSDPAFVSGFVAGSSMRIDLHRRPIATLDLTSSRIALVGLFECQRQVDEALAQPDHDSGADASVPTPPTVAA